MASGAASPAIDPKAPWPKPSLASQVTLTVGKLKIEVNKDRNKLEVAVRTAGSVELGIGFCFAPVFHSGLRHAAVARREMGVPTAFNFLGPLTNPGRPRSAAVGCADARMAPLLADVFQVVVGGMLVFLAGWLIGAG